MRKYLLLLSFLAVSAGSAIALSAGQQLDAMKEIFIKEFQKIDANSDGVLSQDEYLTAQFENFRANIIEAEGFKPAPKVDSKDTSAPAPTPSVSSETELGGVPQALKDMAEFDLDDSMFADDIDSEVPENKEESIKDLLKEMEQDNLADETTPVIAEPSLAEPVEDIKTDLANDKAAQFEMMMSTIRQTLPKKIDDITTWTDIEYKDDTISYIYQADIDTSKFSASETEALKSSIQNEACAKAYQEMCPKIKPMFIDQGINMRIRYFDKNKTELDSCEFNETSCK